MLVDSQKLVTRELTLLYSLKISLIDWDWNCLSSLKYIKKLGNNSVGNLKIDIKFQSTEIYFRAIIQNDNWIFVIKTAIDLKKISQGVTATSLPLNRFRKSTIQSLTVLIVSMHVWITIFYFYDGQGQRECIKII